MKQFEFTVCYKYGCLSHVSFNSFFLHQPSKLIMSNPYNEDSNSQFGRDNTAGGEYGNNMDQRQTQVGDNRTGM
jgi:hypothetical protein